ncbi:MAG: hypothetical protein M1826_004006 [Phylliscum demangeonii]|nr:MAG: hypothetical protein M1826_004006 [Phylliscum demangeonii]
MRGRRSKQYRKLMQQYSIGFGFREPYQVLLDADIIQDAARFKMDVVAGLERTLHGKIKPSASDFRTGSIRYAEPPVPALVDQAKAYERRRCNHHTLTEPLSTQECLSTIVNPKGSGINKHRYVVASQNEEVRASLHQIPGVPLVYIRRSVMIIEPMAGATKDARENEERRKFRSALRGKEGSATLSKRKREEDVAAEEANFSGLEHGAAEDTGIPPPRLAGNGEAVKKKKTRGPKEPNPLSIKKPKKRTVTDEKMDNKPPTAQAPISEAADAVGRRSEGADESSFEVPLKKKRRPKHSSHRKTHAEEATALAVIGDMLASK